MAAIVVRKLSDETHRALRARAAKNGRSTEAEVREILDAAVRPSARVKVGSALVEAFRPFGGVDLDVSRDKTSVEPPTFD